LLGRNDPTLGANAPAAGVNGQALYVTDLSQPDWTDAQRTTLNSSACNIVRRMFGGVRNYGWRALVNATSDPSWVDFGNARLFVALTAELNGIGENYIFLEIDGQDGNTITSFHGALAGVLLNHFYAGDLFGATPDTSFAIDTGPQVNTLQTIANNELHAIVRVKMAPFAEYVVIQIAKRQVTQTL
jgi:hypothetical protein